MRRLLAMAYRGGLLSVCARLSMVPEFDRTALHAVGHNVVISRFDAIPYIDLISGGRGACDGAAVLRPIHEKEQAP